MMVQTALETKCVDPQEEGFCVPFLPAPLLHGAGDFQERCKVKNLGHVSSKRKAPHEAGPVSG
ncbi:hypothetical protein [Leisingera sp.]|uniref:hypothetical protein n=1 Tax=Leisingera sp. TaxID=1879318 RepID=UPI002B26C954|nr:hypothetical protein [Leisingera sp.]